MCIVRVYKNRREITENRIDSSRSCCVVRSLQQVEKNELYPHATRQRKTLVNFLGKNQEERAFSSHCRAAGSFVSLANELGTDCLRLAP